MLNATPCMSDKQVGPGFGCFTVSLTKLWCSSSVGPWATHSAQPVFIQYREPCLSSIGNRTSNWDHSELAEKYWEEYSFLMSIQCYNSKKNPTTSLFCSFLWWLGTSILLASIAFSPLWQCLSPFEQQPMEGDRWTNCLLKQISYLLCNK